MIKKNQPTKDEIIANLLKDGKSYRFIQSELKVGNTRISRISSQIANNQRTITSAKMGRPSKITPNIIQTVQDETLRDPRIGGTSLSHIILNTLGISISSTTVNFIRNQLKFHFQSPRRRPFLTEGHIANRISFCQDQLKNEINWEDGVIFTDESRFCLRDDSRRIWLKRGIYNEKSFTNEKKYNQGIMVWGAIGKNWRSPLIMVKGKLNSNGYIQLLNDNDIFGSLNQFYGQNNFHFEQDGAPAHRAKNTINWIKNQNVQIIENWPANSPDLSCIENVWSILETKIQKYKIESLNHLYLILQKEWYAIPDEKLNSLISQTPKRFQLCLCENGKSIGHKLYTLKKRTEFNLNTIFTQNNNDDISENENLTPLLGIPLNQVCDKNFCEIIIQKLLECGVFPYILKISNENHLIPDYKSIIKHHLSIYEILEKLKKDEYQNPLDIIADINLMWENLRMFYGNDHEVVEHANNLKNDIDIAWKSSKGMAD